jgi:hypothetical protein
MMTAKSARMKIVTCSEGKAFRPEEENAFNEKRRVPVDLLKTAAAS